MSWFKKKDEQTQTVVLPGAVGNISVPADLTVEEEDKSTILAYPPGEEKLTFRFSCISFEKKGDDESAGRSFVKDRAAKEGLKYTEIKNTGVLTYEEESEQDGTPLLVRYWEAGAGNSLVIISATIIQKKQNDKAVRKALDAVPAMLESIRITKFHKVIEGNGSEVRITVTTMDPVPQTVAVFSEADLDWLRTNLERARALGVKYGSAGELGPEELDRVFSRWMNEQGEKEENGHIANALGAAFGAFLVQEHGFDWVVVTDEFGTEYAVKHQAADSIAFPRSSVEKRIEDQEPEFFQNVCLLILDNIKHAGG